MPVRYAIISDVHGRRQKLEAVLSDAWARGAEQVISLGDVGGDACLLLLRQARVLAVFGNYEVSGWRRVATEHRDWIRGWPSLLVEDGFLAVHAAPWWPGGLHTVEDFGKWLKETRQSWRALFPYLTDEDGVWRALAELEETGKAVLFHGHTHQQAIWRWGATGRLRKMRAAAVDVEAGQRYVVGVGSVGLPEDGGWAAYTLYDSDPGRIEFIRLNGYPPSTQKAPIGISRA